MFDTKEDKETIGKRIRAVRRQRDMTQVQLAEQLTLRGIKKNQTDIAKYESGVYMPREVTLNTICSILDIDPNYIIFGIEPTLSIHKIPVGREYLLTEIQYNSDSISKIHSQIGNNYIPMKQPKAEIRDLAQKYLDHYDDYLNDNSWDEEDLYALYLFWNFINRKHANGYDDEIELYEQLFKNED